MMINQLQKKAEQLADLIKAPVNIELNNCGGYDLVLWIGDKDAEQPGICSCFDDEDCKVEDYEPLTAADKVWDELQSMIGLVEWLKKTGRLNENFNGSEAE